MCLMLYLGTDKPMTVFREHAAAHLVNVYGTARKLLPQELATKNHCYFIGDDVCSCLFLGDKSGTLTARERLVEIATVAFEMDREAVFYAEWLGDTLDSAPDQRRVQPENFKEDATWPDIIGARVFYRLDTAEWRIP